MMVLGPKHVGVVLMCKFYICAVVGIITELQLNIWHITHPLIYPTQHANMLHVHHVQIMYETSNF